MDPKGVKLTFRQMVQPLFKTIRKSDFALMVAVMTVVLSITVWWATMMPSISSYFLFDCLVRFTLAALQMMACILAIAGVHDLWTETMEEKFQEFKRELNNNMLDKKKKVLESIIDEEILK